MVPIYNHWHLVPDLLEYLARQQQAVQEFEILLADNGSDSIPPIPDLPSNARVLQCERPGSYAARNHAIGQARGRIIAFTDADCRPSPQWLSGALAVIDRHRGDRPIVAGAVRIVPADATCPNAYELFDMILGIPQERYARLGFGATANLVVPREIFERTGVFDEGRYSGGDAEFCRRATADGASVLYHADSLVEHPARRSWRDIAAKARRIKGGQLRAGPSRQRAAWAVRTLFPPVLSWHKVMTAPGLTRVQQLAVCAVHGRLWALGMWEALLLLTRIKPPER